MRKEEVVRVRQIRPFWSVYGNVVSKIKGFESFNDQWWVPALGVTLRKDVLFEHEKDAVRQCVHNLTEAIAQLLEEQKQLEKRLTTLSTPDAETQA